MEEEIQIYYCDKCQAYKTHTLFTSNGRSIYICDSCDC